MFCVVNQEGESADGRYVLQNKHECVVNVNVCVILANHISA